MRQIPKIPKGSRLVDGTIVDALVDFANAYNVITIPGSTYTLLATDLVNQYLLFTNAVAVTLTVPSNSTLPLPVGTQIPFEQGGAGAITVIGAAGVTVNTRLTLVSAGQYAVLMLVKTGFNNWELYGDAAAAPVSIDPWFETFENVIAGPLPGTLLNPHVYRHNVTSSGNAGLSYVRFAFSSTILPPYGLPYWIRLATLANPADKVRVNNSFNTIGSDALLSEASPTVEFSNAGTSFISGWWTWSGRVFITQYSQGVRTLLTSDGNEIFNLDADWQLSSESLDGAGVNPTLSAITAASNLLFVGGAARTLHLPVGGGFGQRKAIVSNTLITCTLPATDPLFDDKGLGNLVFTGGGLEYTLLEWNTSGATQESGKWRCVAGKGYTPGTY